MFLRRYSSLVNIFLFHEIEFQNHLKLTETILEKRTNTSLDESIRIKQIYDEVERVTELIHGNYSVEDNRFNLLKE